MPLEDATTGAETSPPHSCVCPHCSTEQALTKPRNDGTFECGCGGEFSFSWCSGCAQYSNALPGEKGQATVTCTSCTKRQFDAQCPSCHIWCVVAGDIKSGKTVYHQACGTWFRTCKVDTGYMWLRCPALSQSFRHVECPHCSHHSEWHQRRSGGSFMCPTDQGGCGKPFSFTFCRNCRMYSGPHDHAKGHATSVCPCGAHNHDAMCPTCDTWVSFRGDLIGGKPLTHGECGTSFAVIKTNDGVMTHTLTPSANLVRCPHCLTQGVHRKSPRHGLFRCQRCSQDFSHTFCFTCNKYGAAHAVEKGQATVTCSVCAAPAYDAQCPACGAWCSFPGFITDGAPLVHRRCGVRFFVVSDGFRYTSEVSNPNTMIRVHASHTPIATGTSRVAYEATVTYVTEEDHAKFGFERGEVVVAKVLRSKLRRQGFHISEEDTNMHLRARVLARTFMRHVAPNVDGSPAGIVFLHAMLWRQPPGRYHARSGSSFRGGETWLVEKKLPGKFRKFNSNTGWADERHPLPQFFSHWTYVRSGGKELVCDLQGVLGRPGEPASGMEELSHFAGVYDSVYLLTDPAIMTTSRRWGLTDLGRDGINEWFQVRWAVWALARVCCAAQRVQLNMCPPLD